MKKINTHLTLILLLFGFIATAQIDSTAVPMDTVVTPDGQILLVPRDTTDYTKFAGGGDYSGEVKNFCTSGVEGISPNKMIGVAYDYVGGFTLNSQTQLQSGNYADTNKVSSNDGIRFLLNVPVYSRTRLILNAGLTYWESRYRMDNPQSLGEFASSLNSPGLRTLGVNLTAFLPLNSKNFLIFQGSADLNGDYKFSEIGDRLKYTKLTGAALFGWKFKPTVNFAFGVTQTWRGGERLIIPVVLYNHTFNSRWGVEMLLPARANLRYNFSPRSLLMLGGELEGNSYNVNANLFNVNAGLPQSYPSLELRRSEIRARLTYERSLYQFIWLSVQAGVRLNYRFNVSENNNVDRGEFVITNDIGRPFYTSVGIYLVTP